MGPVGLALQDSGGEGGVAGCLIVVEICRFLVVVVRKEIRQLM